MPKGNRALVQLVSTAGTGYVYTTTKNERKSRQKPRLENDDPRGREHVPFVEGKP